MASGVFPPDYFVRYDEREDRLFYDVPRKAVYLHREALARLQEFFLRVLPHQGTFLDLMSSWRSHTPAELRPALVVGLGLNADEMADNAQLDEYVIHDLNKDPVLPFADELFDAVLCTVSVQYLVMPVDVYREVNRVLKPAGLFVIAFSNHFFPEKAIAIWRVATPAQRTSLVVAYFEESGNWGTINTVDYAPDAKSHTPSGSLHIVWAKKLMAR